MQRVVGVFLLIPTAISDCTEILRRIESLYVFLSPVKYEDQFSLWEFCSQKGG